MEDWQLDFEWLRIRHYVKDALEQKDLPDLNTLLILIGVQEVGIVQARYSKSEKQDLMHVGVCTLLSLEGYYQFEGRDPDGWPHFTKSLKLDIRGEHTQERLLKVLSIRYFDELNQESFTTSPNKDNAQSS
jgi:hypothetical protein